MGFFADNEQLILQFLVMAILAVSLQLMLRSGVFSLASVGFFTLGAYTAGITGLRGWGTIEILAAAVVGGAVGGYLLSLLLRRLRGLYLAMGTIAFNLVIPILAINIGDFTGGSTGLYGIPTFVSSWQVLPVLVLACLAVSQLERRWSGRAQLATRFDEGLARSVGVNTLRSRDRLFAVSAALGCVAGALNALAFSIVTPTESGGFALTTLAVTMVVLGGRDTWIGAVLGALILTWIPTLIGGLGEWQTVCYGLALAVMMVLAPDGLVGIARDLTARARRRTKRAHRPSVGHSPQPTMMAARDDE